MHPILSKLFQKKGIESYEELSKEEKDVFDGYEKTLSKKELTLEDLKTFLGQQVGIIEAKWKDYEMLQIRKAELIPYHTVYKTILSAISAPQTEREALEKYLNQLL